MGFLRALDGWIARASNSGRRDEEPGLGRWREPPYFYWRHAWGRGDAVAAILVVSGLVNAGIAIASSRYAHALLWFGLTVLGCAVFALVSLYPVDRDK